LGDQGTEILLFTSLSLSLSWSKKLYSMEWRGTNK